MQESWSEGLRELPVPILVAVGVLVVAQVALQVFALVDLARRTRVLGDRKWVWVLVVLAGNLLGAIVYLAVGRRPTTDASLETAEPGSEASAQRAIDVLYGKDDER